MGDRAVRPIAVSTSFSIEARLPAMISSSTGSTGPVLSPVSVGLLLVGLPTRSPPASLYLAIC
jgi:hypothetical protein